MKTQFTLWQKVANTPPIALLVLFAWLLLPFNVSADPVTVEWGDWATPARSFPDGTVTVNGITLSEHLTFCPASGWTIGGGLRTYRCAFVAGENEYLDITVTEGKVISSVSASPWNNGGGDLYIQYSSSAVYDGSNLLEGAKAFTGNDQSGYALSQIDAPSGAKSARMYSSAECNVIRLAVTIDDEVACVSPVTATFDKGDALSGSVPADKDICTDFTRSLTLPGKNTLVYDTKHAFVGWEKDGVTYAEDSTYTITDADIIAGSIEFTAVWREVNVTDLTITDPVNNTIPLSWKIPGICDVKGGTDPIFIPNNGYNQFGVLSSTNYNNEDDYDFITANGNSPIYGQYGIGFDIPATKDLSWFSYEWKGDNSNVSLCATACSNSQAYWDASSPTSLNNNTNWTPQGPYTLKNTWWDGGLATNPEVSQIVIFANVGTATNGISFSVRNIRYGITGRENIDHIVLVRKAGSVPANVNDGNQIYTGTKSHFTDTDVKTPGTTYYYAVFAVYSDASVSSPVYVSHTMETVDTYNVTYAKGGDDVTGEVPVDEAEYAENNSVTIAGQNNLARAGYTFGGWNDGSTTYAPDASYTMPAHNVTFTAVWTPFTVPTVTNLSLDGVDKTVDLSWNIPGFIDLNTAKITPSSSFSTAYSTLTYASDATVNSNGELVVTYSANGGGSITGFLFDVNLSNVEAVYYDYKGDYTGSGWDGIFPGIYCSENSTMYWEGGSHDLSNVDWQSKETTTFNSFWKSGTYASENISELGFFANACNDAVENGHMYIRNLRYHCTGQIDIDHIVLVRKDGSEPADPTDGDVLPAGNRFAFVDDDAAKVDGHTYYYKVFSVHADGSYSAPEAVSYTVPAPPALTTYTRENLNVGDFGTICLPYAIEAANREGVELFEIESWAENGTSMTMTQLNENENMIAGRPYIFQATANTATFSYYVDGDETPVGTHNGLIGSYVEAQIQENDNNYIIYNNKLYLVNAPARVGAYRAYIHRGGEYSPAPANRRRVTMGLYGTQTTTDINQISTEQITNKVIRNGHLFILRGDKIYNAQGQLVQ